MSKKFLPFSGRLALRKNGLIDITSPDDALAGFRVTLREGTESHSLALDALEEAGLTPARQREFYATDLYHDVKEVPGVLVGLTEEGEALHLPVPDPGATLWILGDDPEQSAHFARLQDRCGNLTAADLTAWPEARMTLVKLLTMDDTAHASEASASALVAELIAQQKERQNKFLQFLFIPWPNKELQIALHNNREAFAEHYIVPIVSTSRAVGLIGDADTVLVFRGADHHDHRIDFSLNAWTTRVPLGRAFYLEPTTEKPIRFRAV